MLAVGEEVAVLCLEKTDILKASCISCEFGLEGFFCWLIHKVWTGMAIFFFFLPKREEFNKNEQN